MTMKVGFSRNEIHCFIPGIGMMGYGMPHNIVKSVATSLYARAVIFADAAESYFIFINLELAFVSIAVKEEVTRRLKAHFPDWNLDLSRIMITSQHTHSAPGGYSHYPFYNFTIPGFRPQIFEAIVTSSVDAVVDAAKNLAPSVLKLGSHDVPAEDEIAFNRSMKAYLKNPEAKDLREDDSHLAINRRMDGLLIFTPEGELRAHLNWFGVHATSVSSFNTRIHHDNKGVAAKAFEDQHHGALAIFAQGAAGDVSPNYIWDKKLNRNRGKYADQYESAAHNGELHCRNAEKLVPTKLIDGPIHCAHLYRDLSLSSGAPAHGVSFFCGTLEGPGISEPMAQTLRFISRSVRAFRLATRPEAHRAFYEAQGTKDVILDHRRGEFLGLSLDILKLIPFRSTDLGSLLDEARLGALETLPWVPAVLPHQIVTIGSLMLVGVPGEITTIAAQRLKLALQAIYQGHDIIISSYANAYMGYVTTPEEYDVQCYEGGHTVYGRETLNRLIEGFEDLALHLKSQAPLKNQPEPLYFPAQELNLRTIESL